MTWCTAWLPCPRTWMGEVCFSHRKGKNIDEHWHLKLQTMSPQSTQSTHVFCVSSLKHNPALRSEWRIRGWRLFASYHKLLDDFWSELQTSNTSSTPKADLMSTPVLTVRREQVCCTLQGCFIWTFQHDSSASPNVDKFAVWNLRDWTASSFAYERRPVHSWREGLKLRVSSHTRKTGTGSTGSTGRTGRTGSSKFILLKRPFSSAMPCQTFKMCFYGKAILAAAEFQISEQAESLGARWHVCVYIYIMYISYYAYIRS